jgi:hypothetical protein
MLVEGGGDLVFPREVLILAGVVGGKYGDLRAEDVE